MVGPADDPRTVALHRTALRATAPGAAVAWGEPDAAVADLPALLRDRPLRDGVPTAYVCRRFACAAPTTDPQTLAAQLS